jgi:F-type H+-transporting ATPase subunit b
MNDVMAVIVVAQAEGPAAVEAASGAGEVEHPETVPFPPFDATYFPSQLLWLAITFVAMYLLVARVVLPRIGGILEDRRDRIADDLDQAERLKQQSDEALEAYERALAKARADAFSIGEKAREAAKAVAAEQQADVEADLNKRLAAAEARIGEIKRKALAEVDAVAADVAQAVVETLLGKRPTTQEVGAAVAAAGAQEADDV